VARFENFPCGFPQALNKFIENFGENSRF